MDHRRFSGFLRFPLDRPTLRILDSLRTTMRKPRRQRCEHDKYSPSHSDPCSPERRGDGDGTHHVECEFVFLDVAFQL